MRSSIYKHYEIIGIESLDKTGDNTAKLFRIKNTQTENVFTYVTKLSGTLEAIENIDNESKYFSAVSQEIYKYLDQGIENHDTQVVVTTWTREEQKNSGIFYTPKPVVEFIYDILNVYKTKDDQKNHRWQSHKPESHYPSVIDPAAGGGDFLKTAIQKGFTKAEWVFGMDIDKTAVNRWKDINLLSEFGGNSQDLQAHFFHQNGLDDIQWSQHINSYKYNLKKTDIANQQFDAVVGNPPYGGVGLNKEDLTDSLVSNLVHSEIIPVEVKKELIQVDSQMGGLFKWHQKEQLSDKALKRLASFPIEVLFVERFINLAKSGGWIAMIIPDGILTNSNLSYVREFIARRCIIEAVVSLPRDTFKAVKTNAKTSIIILKKRKSVENKPKDYPVFIGSTEKIDTSLLTNISNNYNQFYNSNKKNMDNNKNIFTINDSSGKEVVMIRTDKTIYDLMSEKPASRWDPGYWEPKHEKLLAEINSKYKLVPLLSLITSPIIAPDHVRASKGESIGENYKNEYRTLKDLLYTGINYARKSTCSDNAYNRLRRSQLELGDILFAGSGIGAIGRVGIVEKVAARSCVGDLFIIRGTKVNPYWLYVFLLTKYGQAQIEKIFHGIQSAKISSPEISSIKIPNLDEKNQLLIEQEYKNTVSKYHFQAIDGKSKGDETVFRKNIEIAEKALRILLSKVEIILRGEKDELI